MQFCSSRLQVVQRPAESQQFPVCVVVESGDVEVVSTTVDVSEVVDVSGTVEVSQPVDDSGGGGRVESVSGTVVSSSVVESGGGGTQHSQVAGTHTPPGMAHWWLPFFKASDRVSGVRPSSQYSHPSRMPLPQKAGGG
jgi:hypothetical protein